MASLYYRKLVPNAFASTTEAAQYPVSNMAFEALGRPYRSAGLAEEPVTLTLPAPEFVQALYLHDVNFDACTVQTSADGLAFDDVGLVNAYADENGRYRLLCVIAAAGKKAVRFVIPAGAANDGATQWNCGAAYLFGSVAALPAGPSYGYAPRTRRPRFSEDLPNGITSQAVTGLNVDAIDLPWDRKFSQSLRTLKQEAGKGTVVLSLDVADWPWQMWPVRWRDQEATESFYKVHKAQGKLTLTEVV